jgi:hypothetical protein
MNFYEFLKKVPYVHSDEIKLHDEITRFDGSKYVLQFVLCRIVARDSTFNRLLVSIDRVLILFRALLPSFRR